MKEEYIKADIAERQRLILNLNIKINVIEKKKQQHQKRINALRKKLKEAKK